VTVVLVKRGNIHLACYVLWCVSALNTRQLITRNAICRSVLWIPL